METPTGFLILAMREAACIRVETTHCSIREMDHKAAEGHGGSRPGLEPDGTIRVHLAKDQVGLATVIVTVLSDVETAKSFYNVEITSSPINN